MGDIRVHRRWVSRILFRCWFTVVLIPKFLFKQWNIYSGIESHKYAIIHFIFSVDIIQFWQYRQEYKKLVKKYERTRQKVACMQEKQATILQKMREFKFLTRKFQYAVSTQYQNKCSWFLCTFILMQVLLCAVLLFNHCQWRSTTHLHSPLLTPTTFFSYSQNTDLEGSSLQRY
jgi:cell shape-determining protein MreC